MIINLCNYNQKIQIIYIMSDAGMQSIKQRCIKIYISRGSGKGKGNLRSIPRSSHYRRNKIHLQIIYNNIYNNKLVQFLFWRKIPKVSRVSIFQVQKLLHIYRNEGYLMQDASLVTDSFATPTPKHTHNLRLIRLFFTIYFNWGRLDRK